MAGTGTAPQTPAGQPPRAARPATTPARSAPGPVSSTVDSGAGFVLGLLVWGWVILPFLTGGPTAVRYTLRAKFFNKAADGSWLP